MSVTVGDRIKQVRESKGMTQGELGKACGVTKQTIFKYESNIITNIPLDRLAKIADALVVSSAYLMGWSDSIDRAAKKELPLPEMKEWPVIGATACGDPIHREVFDETVWAPVDINAEAVYRCDGDSMINARIFDGDLVFINTELQVDDGQIALVRIGEEYTLKRVYRGEGVLQLVSENPAYPIRVISDTDLEDTEIVGKAVYFMSRVI